MDKKDLLLVAGLLIVFIFLYVPKSSIDLEKNVWQDLDNQTSKFLGLKNVDLLKNRSFCNNFNKNGGRCFSLPFLTGQGWKLFYLLVFGGLIWLVVSRLGF